MGTITVSIAELGGLFIIVASVLGLWRSSANRAEKLASRAEIILENHKNLESRVKVMEEYIKLHNDGKLVCPLIENIKTHKLEKL